MTTKLTDEQIAELERLLAAATPGRWESRAECLNNWPASDPQPDALVEFILNSADEDAHPAEDGDLFAAARNALPSLLSEVRASRAGGPAPDATAPRLPPEIDKAIHALTDAHRAAEALGEHASIRQDRAAIVTCDEAYCILVDAILRALAAPPRSEAPPDANAPCHHEARIEGVLHVCNRTKGHPPPHVLELLRSEEARTLYDAASSFYRGEGPYSTVAGALTALRALSAPPRSEDPPDARDPLREAAAEVVAWIPKLIAPGGLNPPGYCPPLERLRAALAGPRSEAGRETPARRIVSGDPAGIPFDGPAAGRETGGTDAGRCSVHGVERVTCASNFIPHCPLCHPEHTCPVEPSAPATTPPGGDE